MTADQELVDDPRQDEPDEGSGGVPREVRPRRRPETGQVEQLLPDTGGDGERGSERDARWNRLEEKRADDVAARRDRRAEREMERIVGSGPIDRLRLGASADEP